MDLGGLSILAVAFSLILLPFTLYKAQASSPFFSSLYPFIIHHLES